MAGSRPKDSQQTKFFNAEREIVQKIGTTFRDERSAVQFLQHTTRLKRWRTYVDAGLVSPYPVQISFENTGYMCDHTLLPNRHTLICGPDDRNDIYVLHVLAHHAAPAGAPLHGPQFIKIFLDLIDRYIGKDQRREAKDVLIEWRVKTRYVGADTRAKQQQNYLLRQAPDVASELAAILEELGRDDD